MKGGKTIVTKRKYEVATCLQSDTDSDSDSVHLNGKIPKRTISRGKSWHQQNLMWSSPNFHVSFWCLLQIQCLRECISSFILDIFCPHS